MLITEIVNRVNAMLAGEMLTYSELRYHLDEVIDDINTMLTSTYPTFSDLGTNAKEYNVFPDKYIRSVVVPGAAFKFYTMDEEGADVAPALLRRYEQGKFYMTRDWISSVPPEYEDDEYNGIIGMPELIRGGGDDVNSELFKI